MTNLTRTSLLNEGKTKRIWRTNEAGVVFVESKDDITAGDGAKHDVLPNKGAWSTTTTCNVFQLLSDCGIPIAFLQQLGPNEFSAKNCRMIPLEVVVRREAHGSYLKRNPHLSKGHYFSKLVYELYLKTSGRKWASHDLPCDDPMINLKGEVMQLFVPSKPLWDQKPFLEVPLADVIAEFGGKDGLEIIRENTLRTFLIIEKAWQLLNQKLVDFKVEFGMAALDDAFEILLSDVIDSDSWRKIKDGKYSDKQVYRDGGQLSEVAEKLREAAELTGQFRLPKQQIIVWTGSDKDNKAPLLEEFKRLDPRGNVKPTLITCSAHKEPVMAFRALQKALQDIPDSVVIAYVGMSNGAGPTLSANCTVPVITVPAGYKEFPEDVWSSLRTPSAVPVMTVLEPKNAILAALNILAARNPALYANLRYEQEKRMPNTIVLGID